MFIATFDFTEKKLRQLAKKQQLRGDLEFLLGKGFREDDESTIDLVDTEADDEIRASGIR